VKKGTSRKVKNPQNHLILGRKRWTLEGKKAERDHGWTNLKKKTQKKKEDIL